jgi:histidinol phosphatase-like PHP family hydrolase
MPAAYDFHIHTTYLKCADETMTVPALLQRCESLGLQTIAITDHLNAPQFLPQHELIKRDLAATETPLEVFFGCEVNVTDPETGAVSIDQAQLERGGFEVVIGGVHASYHDHPDKRGIIDLQQRLMLAVIANPLIDVLVHPWWFGGEEFRPGGPMEWFRDMSDIPDDYARELGEAAVAHDTAIEANWSAIWGNTTVYGPKFLEGYNRYLRIIADTGARISISTDAHNINQLDGIHPMMDVIEQLAIPASQLWRPQRGRRP